MINALIVDDDMATVEVVRNAVHWKQLGVENVSKAYNIEQAKRILLNEPINLVISDVEMPMGSGLDLLRWFREQKMDGEFLLLTCHEDFSYAFEALHNRAAEYLLKPFDVDVMEVALRRIIIRIKEQQALKKNGELGVWVKDNYDGSGNYLFGIVYWKEDLKRSRNRQHRKLQKDSWHLIHKQITR